MPRKYCNGMVESSTIGLLSTPSHLVSYTPFKTSCGSVHIERTIRGESSRTQQDWGRGWGLPSSYRRRIVHCALSISSATCPIKEDNTHGGLTSDRSRY